ncbi:MAG TPA: hypothetical protein VMS38_17585, partial [Pseudorhodoferax sp.]|nr:hypothetical protein [Pseudorhodoferax sp.]
MNTVHTGGSAAPFQAPHSHVFLGADHARNERRVWLVIALTASMMLVEIVAGTRYGSMALVADGWHMSTHAGAMLITALAGDLVFDLLAARLVIRLRGSGRGYRWLVVAGAIPCAMAFAALYA